MYSNVVASPARRLLWMRLARISGAGNILIKRAIDRLGSAESLLSATPIQLSEIEGMTKAALAGFAKLPSEAEAQREIDFAAERGVRVLCPDDSEWPPGLRTIHDPPVVLFVRGKLIPHDAVAIGVVGSRECTFYGREQAERFGALLAGAGLTIVSGGARGIDTGAHFGALKNKGRTAVVLGCGHGHVYPPENKGLFERIVEEERGAVIAELPFDTPPHAKNFLPRNRIIAGMSLGVLVVEANLKSGSLVTARLAAADYGREVFALPGRVDSATSRGTHHLIKTGSATLVDCLDDILDHLGDLGDLLRKHTAKRAGSESPDLISPGLFDSPAAVAPEKKSAPAIPLTPPQQKILAALESTGKELSIDDLCMHTELAAPSVMAELTLLQIRGHISRTPGNRFAKKRS